LRAKKNKTKKRKVNMESEKMQISEAVQAELNTIIIGAYKISEGLGKQVELALKEGLQNPLTAEEAAQLLTKVITVMRKSAAQRGDEQLSRALQINVNQIVSKMIEARDRIAQVGDSSEGDGASLRLFPYKDVEVKIIKPTPYFNGHPVPMRQGYLRTRDIQLWSENERLDIHLHQFKEVYKRPPTSDELVQLLLSKVPLPGLKEIPEMSKAELEDFFKIKGLARSIAANGVQRPPILDIDGTLLDGNRRVAACQYILDSDEFELDAKKRAEYIYVWQLTEERTEADCYNVVVTLNFEPSYKEDWPEYIRIRKIYEAYQEQKLMYPVAGERADLEIRRGIAKKFAVELITVTRWIRMMEWVLDFEEYMVNKKDRDEYQVKYRANKYIQYFDEISKGETPGKVGYELSRDEALKEVVYDLLYDGKFENFAQMRNLKYIYDDGYAREILEKARDTTDIVSARRKLDDAWAIASAGKATEREILANKRIDEFADWLEKLPPKTFRDALTISALNRLLNVLKLIERLVTTVIDNRGEEAE
jgi:hypothetical protein